MAKNRRVQEPFPGPVALFLILPFFFAQSWVFMVVVDAGSRHALPILMCCYITKHACLLWCSFVFVIHCETGKDMPPAAQSAGPFCFPRYRAAHGRAQEPTPGFRALFGWRTLSTHWSHSKHCWFLSRGGGGEYNGRALQKEGHPPPPDTPGSKPK